MPLRRRLRIETHRHMGWALVIDQIDQRIREPELRICIAPLRRDPRTADQRIIRPEDECHRIQKEYPFIQIFHATNLGISREAVHETVANIFSFKYLKNNYYFYSA